MLFWCWSEALPYKHTAIFESSTIAVGQLQMGTFLLLLRNTIVLKFFFFTVFTVGMKNNELMARKKGVLL